MDSSNHELVGVGFLCIDRLEYLLDHEETIAVVGFSGFPLGSIKLTVKAYIDEVQALPTTIITHVEANVQNFMDHNLIVNFYFDYISGLPENHCTDTYISFKFMSHMPTYTTPHYLGTNTDPSFESTVQVTKPITVTLIDYLRTGCMEFKVFSIKNNDNDPFRITDGNQSGLKTISSWKSITNSLGSSRSSSFKGDKTSLEKKLNQTIQKVDLLINEKNELENKFNEINHQNEYLIRENQALRDELQSARAEIDNMYNITRGDGATIISNHESTMMPTTTVGRVGRGFMGLFRGNSMGHSNTHMIEVKPSRACAIM